ncbi:MAG: kaiB domain protein [Verrucomicrobiales bacterium]|nr:kaiB domain protein [Verrucomicrobiales bacterium]
MKTDSIREETRKWEKALAKVSAQTYCLRLYVSGSTPKSSRAIANIKRICEEYLKGRYTLEVIDIYQQPVLARGEQIIAAPTLIKRLPLPLRKFIGDMAHTDKILLGLDLTPVGLSENADGKTKRANNRD